TLGGDVTATSDATPQTATITGQGTLSLGGSTRTFTVGNGPQATDLLVGAVVAGTGSEGIVKEGLGMMDLTNTNTYTGLTTVHAGTLQVDGTIADVALTGGTLQGIGTVGNLDGTGGGIVAPGDSPGILNSGAVTLNGETILNVEINGNTPGNGAGHYDQL